MSALRSHATMILLTQKGIFCLGTCLLGLTLSGCRHIQAPPTLPAILKSPDLQPPAPPAPAMESAPPESISNAPAVKVTETKPKRRLRKSSTKLPEPAPAPAEPSLSKPLPESSQLGALSAGGEQDPRNQQEAGDLIASTIRRLEALSKSKGDKVEPQVANQTREVRRFLQQAREALSTGDAEGAKTLSTKAKLLMDDLEKWTQQ